MSQLAQPIPVFLETGGKRVYAGAVDWPGWYGSGRDENAALQSLLLYGARYERVIAATQLSFHVPTALSDFSVVERLPGNSTTDFGAPDVAPTADSEPLDDHSLQRDQAILRASWEALAATYQSAIDKKLRKGPRGGGRELAEIIEHVVNAHASYLRRINWNETKSKHNAIENLLDDAKQATLNALSAAANGDLPAQGPRGGSRWQPRYFVRRATWHILDHVWEIEDRVQE